MTIFWISIALLSLTLDTVNGTLRSCFFICLPQILPTSNFYPWKIRYRFPHVLSCGKKSGWEAAILSRQMAWENINTLLCCASSNPLFDLNPPTAALPDKREPPGKKSNKTRSSDSECLWHTKPFSHCFCYVNFVNFFKAVYHNMDCPVEEKTAKTLLDYSLHILPS